MGFNIVITTIFGTKISSGSAYWLW